MDTSNKSFEGDQPIIGAVLVTKTKIKVKKITFGIFFEKLGNYMLRQVTNASDVVCVVRDIKDQIKYFIKRRSQSNQFLTI